MIPVTHGGSRHHRKRGSLDADLGPEDTAPKRSINNSTCALPFTKSRRRSHHGLPDDEITTAPLPMPRPSELPRHAPHPRSHPPSCPPRNPRGDPQRASTYCRQHRRTASTRSPSRTTGATGRAPRAGAISRGAGRRRARSIPWAACWTAASRTTWAP
jgi:hypothetical protein